MRKLVTILLICILYSICSAEVVKVPFKPRCANNHSQSKILQENVVERLLDSIKNLYKYDTTNAYIRLVDIKRNNNYNNTKEASAWNKAIKNGDYIWSKIRIEDTSGGKIYQQYLMEYLFNPKRYIIEILPDPTTDAIKKTIDSLKNLYTFEIKKDQKGKPYTTNNIIPKYECDDPYYEYRRWKKHINNPDYLTSRLTIKDLSINKNITDYANLIIFLFHPEKFEINISNPYMNTEEILASLEQLKKMYNYNVPFSPNNIIPIYKSDSIYNEHLKWQEHTEYADDLWNSLLISGASNITKEKLIEYLFDPECSVNIKPTNYGIVTYENYTHQNNLGFSDSDGGFYIKQTNDGKTILMISHNDSKYKEAKIIHHRNCTYDQQYESMTIRFKDGSTKTIYNYSPIHEINCDNSHCHEFTDQFNITGINTNNICKIRLTSLYDQFDYENEYMGEMITLMKKAAIKNLKESINRNKF